MINVRLLSFFGPTASGWESEVEITAAAYPCDLWLGSVLTVDDNEEPLEHDESDENSEYREIIFQHRLDRAIERMWRTEVETSRAYSGMPNNPVGFVEDF
jgi:hypothetical protein